MRSFSWYNLFPQNYNNYNENYLYENQDFCAEHQVLTTMINFAKMPVNVSGVFKLVTALSVWVSS